MRLVLWTALAGVGGIGLSGCGQTRVPEEHFYRLVVSPPPVATSAVLDGTLVVRRFVADGLTSQRPLVYGANATPHDLRQYNYHFWADAPPRMLQELTVDVLRNAKVAKQVVTPDTGVNPTYELAGKIKRLEHLRGKPSRVVVRIELALNRVSDGSLVWIEDFAVEKSVTESAVAPATDAMGTALSEIFASMAASLSQKIAAISDR